MTKSKMTFEGLYKTTKGVAVCVRLETNGVPRFETLFIDHSEFTREAINDLSSVIVRWFGQSQDPPWSEEAIPGIG